MNDFCSCDFNPGASYNSWGDFGMGIIPSVPYQIYFNDDLGNDNNAIDEGDEGGNIPGEGSDVLYVKDGVLYIPNSYHAQYKSGNELYIYNETVTYSDSTLGLVND